VFVAARYGTARSFSLTGKLVPPLHRRYLTWIPLAFVFSSRPYYALGVLKPELNQQEQDALHFTQGLASIVAFNVSLERAREIAALSKATALEYWPIDDHQLVEAKALTEGFWSIGDDVPLGLAVTSKHEELQVYIEQIAASVEVLWFSYKQHFPEEIETLRRILSLVDGLVTKFDEISAEAPTELPRQMLREKQLNAIVSGLVDLSAALSYSVTQGTTGSAGILSSPSPFPHHALLGVGSAVRAMTVFIRYLETAFAERSAPDVIENEYPHRSGNLPRSIVNYEPGESYALPRTSAEDEEFDKGGAFPVVVQPIPDFSAQ
jgi:hypothetical protein